MLSPTYPFVRRHPRSWPSVILAIGTWLATLTLIFFTILFNSYAYLIGHWMTILQPAMIDLHIEGASNPPPVSLAAQVRLAGKVIWQTERLHISGLSTDRSLIKLPLRAFGPLEVRLATVDQDGCTNASGIGRLNAAGEDKLALPIELLPLKHRHCPYVKNADPFRTFISPLNRMLLGQD